MKGFPVDISEHGHLLDQLFYLTVYLTAGTFVVVLLLLGYFLFRYVQRPGRKAVYTHGNSRGALALTLGLALAVFVFIDLNLAYHDDHVFRTMFGSMPPDDQALVIDTTAEVFAWTFRYPGPDGKYGKIDLKRADESDPLGLSKVNDPAGKDDIVSRGELVIPVGRDVILKMKSKDVIHSLFLPNMRIKQDVVPGLETKMYFRAAKTGKYEIACAELCGLGHYRMRGVLTVLPPEEFDAWLKKQAAESTFTEE